ncbi:MAG: hypothetical protein ACK50J_23940, partial [Planctomyces sp.]
HRGSNANLCMTDAVLWICQAKDLDRAKAAHIPSDGIRRPTDEQVGRYGLISGWNWGDRL